MSPKDLEKKYIKEIKVNEPQAVAEEMQDIKDWSKEVFVVFNVNAQHRIISREIVSIGTLDSVLIHPREIFRTAILKNAKSIIISHNHPSGDLNPSEEDITVTKELKKAGKILDIQLLDHVIVSKNGHYSFLNNNKL